MGHHEPLAAVFWRHAPVPWSRRLAGQYYFGSANRRGKIIEGSLKYAWGCFLPCQLLICFPSFPSQSSGNDAAGGNELTRFTGISVLIKILSLWRNTRRITADNMALGFLLD